MATKFVLKQNDRNGQTANDAPTTPAEYVFDGEMFTLGSDATNNLILTGSAAEQAVVVREDDRLTLINSAEGTFLNGETLRREAIYPLADGDEIRVGNYTVSVVDGKRNGTAETTETLSSESAPKFAALIENSIPVVESKVSTVGTSAAPVGKSFKQTKSANNFAAVLDTLRTEEDSFYFVVKNKKTETARIPIEQAEIAIGATDKNEIVFDVKKMTTVFGVVRKDWSGIVVETNRRGALFVNGEAIETTKRLRNDDCVGFAAPIETTLHLHEPSLLVALEPLLSARNNSNNGAAIAQTSDKIAASARKTAKPKPPLFERTFFNYFSFVEILTFVIATLIGAVLFFLAFEFMFS